MLTKKLSKIGVHVTLLEKEEKLASSQKIGGNGRVGGGLSLQTTPTPND